LYGATLVQITEGQIEKQMFYGDQPLGF